MKRGTEWRRETVPAKTTTGGGEVPSRRGCGVEVGARTLAKTGMRCGVGEQTVRMKEFAEEVGRTCEDDDGGACVGDYPSEVDRLLSEAK